MDKVYVNCFGHNDPRFAMEHLIWRQISNQVLLTNNVDIVHRHNSKLLWVRMHLLLELHQQNALPNLDQYDKIIISDLLNYDDVDNIKWMTVLQAIKRPDAVCITNNQQLNNIVTTHRVVYHDFLFNRTKLYYLERNKILSYYSQAQDRELRFLWCDSAKEDSYTVNRLNSTKNINKYYNSATNRIFGFRDTVTDMLINSYAEQGYIACRNKGFILESDIQETQYSQLPHYVYDNSFATIAIESTWAEPNIFHATEKTFEPLLKGCFVLPFSNPGYVDQLKTHYNFQLADIFDYTYDLNSNQLVRQEQYLTSIKKFLLYSLKNLQDYYCENFDIINHNRQIFYDRPYDHSVVDLIRNLS
jgi:hypothetical protein